MQKYMVILLLFILVIRCSQSQSGSEEKMDTPLKQKITAVDSENKNEIIKVFGKCGEVINENMKLIIEETGLKVESTIGDIFTASGTANQIRQVSNIKFVTQLSLSTKSELYK